MLETITSRQNPRVKHLLSLKDRKGRERENLFVVEGLAEIQRAAAVYRLTAIYFCPELETSGETAWREDMVRAGLPATAFSPPVFETCAYRENPTGLLTTFECQDHSLASCAVHNPRTVLLLAGLEKPGNIGAIARTARAAGVDLLGFTDPRTDLFNPNIIRGSRGHWFPMEKAIGSPEEWIAFFRTHGITPVRTLVDAGEEFWERDWKSPAALILGEEHAGLDPFWDKLAPAAVTIPAAAEVDSLNVSVAAALILYEIKRQRR